MKYLSTALIIVLMKSSMCFSQDIHITGHLNKENCAKIKHLVNTIDNKFKTKKINLFYQSKLPVFTFLSKDINRDALLDDALKSLSQSKAKDKDGLTKPQIIALYKNKKRLISFNKKGDDFPPSSFNNFDKLINYLNSSRKRKAKFVFQLVFTKEKPIIEIISPQKNATINSTKVEGVSGGTDPISQVLVRVNKGEWKSAEGTTNWSIEIPMQNENRYTIDAIAIDNKNDTSAISTVKDIHYKLIITHVAYVYPIRAKNVVPQCINNGNYDFAFKFQTNYPIERDKLAIVIENSNHQVINRLSLNELSEGSIQEIRRDRHYDYCLFLIYGVLGVTDPCTIISDENYYYYYDTKDPDKLRVPAGKTLIHFQSFDSALNAYPHCNCD